MANIEERGTSAVAWEKGARHKAYDDRYRILCRSIPVVDHAARGEIIAICDGVGSAPRGASAAQVVCDSLLPFFTERASLRATADTIQQLLERANTEISGWGMITDTDRPLGACAGTIVWIDTKLRAHIFHAGDTSALLIRNGDSFPLTSVHHATDGSLANYFGLPSPEIEHRTFQMQLGDRLLLMTDGISKVLKNREVTRIVEEQATRLSSLNELLLKCRVAGSGDDATALLLDIDEEP